MPRLAAVFSLAVATCLLPLREAWAWGELGHRASAVLTEARLSPEARARVHELLEPGESMADASVWADAHAHETRKTPKAWHYVDVPLGEPGYLPRFCAKKGCVVSKIADLCRTLPDKAQSRAEKQLALRLLIHLVEDLHQPLHVGDRHDRGGNDLHVRFFGAATDLHRVWDLGVLEHASMSEKELSETLGALATPAMSEGWSHGPPEAWATESLLLAKEAYVDPEAGAPIEPHASLGQAYFDFALPRVRQRLAQAAVRLAALLNAAFRPVR